VFTTILSRAGCCITTISTLALDMLMGRSSLVEQDWLEEWVADCVNRTFLGELIRRIK
jgi:hypothetical protein